MCLRRPAKKIRVKSQENANFVRLNLRTTKFKAAVRPRVRVHKPPPQATARATVILHREPKVLTAANGCLASPRLHRRPARLSGRRSVDRVIGAACGATVGGLAPAMLPRSAKPSVALRLLLLWCYDAAHLWLTCVVLHVPYPINTHTHTYQTRSDAIEQCLDAAKQHQDKSAASSDPLAPKLAPGQVDGPVQVVIPTCPGHQLPCILRKVKKATVRVIAAELSVCCFLFLVSWCSDIVGGLLCHTSGQQGPSVLLLWRSSI